MIFNQCVLNNFSSSVVVFLQLCDGAAAVKVGILLPAGKAEEKTLRLNYIESLTLWVGLKCVFSCETDTDGVVISTGGRGVDYKPENEVKCCEFHI